MRPSVAIAVLAVAAACQTYTQRRAALVPHATPMATDGQPLDQFAALGLGASNIADPIAPGAGDPRAGDAVPGTQLRGELAIKLAPNFSIWGAYEQGLADGSHPINAMAPDVHNGDVIGAGAGMALSIPIAEHWRIALSGELLIWSVPWVQYTTCVSTNCDVPGYTYSDRGEDTVATLAVGITPSYRSGPLTLFGGVTARNQPTIQSLIYTQDPDNDADVQSGPFNVTLHAGVEYKVADSVQVSLVIHQTVTTDPISYGPGIGLMVRLPFGGRVPNAPVMPPMPPPVFAPMPPSAVPPAAPPAPEPQPLPQPSGPAI